MAELYTEILDYHPNAPFHNKYPHPKTRDYYDIVFIDRCRRLWSIAMRMQDAGVSNKRPARPKVYPNYSTPVSVEEKKRKSKEEKIKALTSRLEKAREALRELEIKIPAEIAKIEAEEVKTKSKDIAKHQRFCQAQQVYQLKVNGLTMPKIALMLGIKTHQANKLASLYKQQAGLRGTYTLITSGPRSFREKYPVTEP